MKQRSRPPGSQHIWSVTIVCVFWEPPLLTTMRTLIGGASVREKCFSKFFGGPGGFKKLRRLVGQIST